MWIDDPKRNSWLLARRSEYSNYIFDPRNRISVPKYLIIDIWHVKLLARWPILKHLATSAPIRTLEGLFWPQKWISRPNLPVVWLSHATFVLNNAKIVKVKNLKYFLQCARAPGIWGFFCAKLYRDYMFESIFRLIQLHFMVSRSQNWKKKVTFSTDFLKN